MHADDLPRMRLIGSLCLGIIATGWAMDWPIIKILLGDRPPISRAA